MDDKKMKPKIVFESFEELFEYYKIPYDKYHDSWKKALQLVEAIYCTSAICLAIYLICKNGEKNAALLVSSLVVAALFIYGCFQAYGKWKTSQFNEGSRFELDEHLHQTEVIDDENVMDYYVDACRDYIAGVGNSLWGELITIILTYAMVPFFGAALGGFFSDLKDEELMAMILQVLVYAGLAIILLIALKIRDRYSENGPFQRKQRAIALLADLQYLRAKQKRRKWLKKNSGKSSENQEEQEKGQEQQE